MIRRRVIVDHVIFVATWRSRTGAGAGGRRACGRRDSDRDDAALVDDPDGNDVEAVSHGPATTPDAPHRPGVP